MWNRKTARTERDLEPQKSSSSKRRIAAEISKQRNNNDKNAPGKWKLTKNRNLYGLPVQKINKKQKDEERKSNESLLQILGSSPELKLLPTLSLSLSISRRLLYFLSLEKAMLQNEMVIPMQVSVEPERWELELSLSLLCVSRFFSL